MQQTHSLIFYLQVTTDKHNVCHPELALSRQESGMKDLIQINNPQHHFKLKEKDIRYKDNMQQNNKKR